MKVIPGRPSWVLKGVVVEELVKGGDLTGEVGERALRVGEPRGRQLQRPSLLALMPGSQGNQAPSHCYKGGSRDWGW